MTLYKGKYRVETTRLQTWDYASDGFYFVTICTRDRTCSLGDIVDGEIRLSPVGEIAVDEWSKSAQIRANIHLDEWVIMPNHVHGILVIDNGSHMAEGETRSVETRCSASLPRPGNTFGPLKSGSLQAVINAYKAAVTRRCRKHGLDDFAWQARYYDRIIRNERELNAAREYIVQNPMRWQLDREHAEGLYM